MAKTITRQQLAGSQGEALVRERANAMGFLFSPYGALEAGIDGLLELRNLVNGEMSGQLVAVQVKATDDSAYTAENEAGFEYLMDAKDVEYWRGSNLPVIIVLVRLGRREAYWKSVEAGEGTGTRRLRRTCEATDAALARVRSTFGPALENKCSGFIPFSCAAQLKRPTYTS
jgi:Domain of unknown function (DUF4365)